MVGLMPNKEIAKTSNLNISETTYRICQIFLGKIFLVDVFHFMLKIGVKIGSKIFNFPDYVRIVIIVLKIIITAIYHFGVDISLMATILPFLKILRNRIYFSLQ